MERFSTIYPFTTENIAGYMDELDLSGKKVITVTGSGDHVINAVANGSKDITTFDINPLAKYYMDLKIAGIENLSYEEFLKIFLYDEKSISLDFIRGISMPNDSKIFWIEQLKKYKDNWIELKKSALFNRKYFNPSSKIWQNNYLEKRKYEKVKEVIGGINIDYLNVSLKDLIIDKEYDYMFLSNISDYLNLMYNSDTLSNYHELLSKFLNNISCIYFAYLYDIGNDNPRSDIDNLEKVESVFGCFDTKTFRSALNANEIKEDGVLILGRDRNVKK